ncbi:3D domain-containing protein [Halobacillus naozhouensis]|uniref:3D domain-containing protein n=1 Tax=Halobacillus naozhouensis TaxID=554880 RepID=UPI00362FB496
MRASIITLSFLFIYLIGLPYIDPDSSAIQADEVTEEEIIHKAETKALDLGKKSPNHERFDKVKRVVNVEATAYTANCEGCSGTTYTGIDLHANPDRKVIAVDPDVIPLGSKVRVPGYGVAVAGDIGGAIDGNRIDIFMSELDEALQFGRQHIQVEILES